LSFFLFFPQVVTLARLLHFAGVTQANRHATLTPVVRAVADALLAQASGSAGTAATEAAAAAAAAGSAAAEDACAAFRHHGLGAFPFAGNKYPVALRRARSLALGTSGAVALRHFGYHPEDWGLQRGKRTQGAGEKLWPVSPRPYIVCS